MWLIDSTTLYFAGKITHHMSGCNPPDCCTRYYIHLVDTDYIHLVGTDYIHLAGRTEDSHTVGHLVAVGNSSDTQLLLRRTVGTVGLVGRLVLRVGKSSRPVEKSWPVGCSDSFALFVLPGYCPLAQQDHLPKS